MAKAKPVTTAAVRDRCSMEESVVEVVLDTINTKATEMVAELREKCPDETMRWAILRQALVIESKSSI
jgi:hypothetical protein